MRGFYFALNSSLQCFQLFVLGHKQLILKLNDGALILNSSFLELLYTFCCLSNLLRIRYPRKASLVQAAWPPVWGCLRSHLQSYAAVLSWRTAQLRGWCEVDGGPEQAHYSASDGLSAGKTLVRGSLCSSTGLHCGVWMLAFHPAVVLLRAPLRWVVELLRVEAGAGVIRVRHPYGCQARAMALALGLYQLVISCPACRGGEGGPLCDLTSFCHRSGFLSLHRSVLALRAHLRDAVA